MEVLETTVNGAPRVPPSYSRKPTSEKAKAANRRNAKKSTGPKTKQGKARSRMNALKHGLTAATLTANDYARLLGDENVESMVEAVRKRYANPCPLVQMQVEVVATVMMKLHVAMKLESAWVASHLPEPIEDQLKDEKGRMTGMDLEQLRYRKKAFEELVDAFEQGRSPELPVSDLEWFVDRLLRQLQPSATTGDSRKTLTKLNRERKSLKRKLGKVSDEERGAILSRLKEVEDSTSIAETLLEKEDARLVQLKPTRKAVGKATATQLVRMIQKNKLSANRTKVLLAYARSLLEDRLLNTDLFYFAQDEAKLVRSHRSELASVASKDPEQICRWQTYTFIIQKELRLALENLHRIAALQLV